MVAIVRYVEPPSLAERWLKKTRLFWCSPLGWRVGLLGLAILFVALSIAIDMARILWAGDVLHGRLRRIAAQSVSQLDGTPAGLSRARSLAAADAEGLVGLTFEFAQNRNAQWVANPYLANNIRAVRVIARAPIRLFLVRWLAWYTAETVWSSASAEQMERRTFSSGLVPYAPIAHSAEDPAFGLRPGQIYTLRWTTGPLTDMSRICPGDRDPALLASLARQSFSRGAFLEIGGRENIRRAILENYQTSTRFIGDQVSAMHGEIGLEHEALISRINQDTDPLSRRYADYSWRARGNGRRMIAAPLRTREAPATIVGAAAFFLLPAAEYRADPLAPFCAEFVGSYLEGSAFRGAAPAGFFVPTALP